MSISKRSFSLYFLVLVFNFTLFSQGRIEGKLEKWNKVTLSFNYKEFSENDEDNPFLNYRLNVTFKNGDEEITIPGFFAADGNVCRNKC
ncbi:DUF5060 domain-containing protein [Polaribacter sejongensis]|uniref:DUF5060 domain-containing protein n=1 Tax=Polaribacter sejongensis TaxID=985043 RepID=UPI0035A71AF3